MGSLLALVLPGLLFVTAACVDLTSDEGDGTSRSSTTESALGASLDATSTTEAASVTTGTTETTVPGTESGDGDDEPVPWGSEATEPGESSDDSTFTVVPFEPTTVRAPDYWTFDEDDNGHRRTIHVGDIVTVELEYPRLAQVTSTRWGPGGGGLIERVSHDETTSLLGRYITGLTDVFLAVAPGDCRILIISWHERDSAYHSWEVYLTVTE
jgi:hypothetical protein